MLLSVIGVLYYRRGHAFFAFFDMVGKCDRYKHSCGCGHSKVCYNGFKLIFFLLRYLILLKSAIDATINAVVETPKSVIKVLNYGCFLRSLFCCACAILILLTKM